MRALRTIALILLACLGVVAATGAVLWSASLAGLARAEVVATDAMAPDFAAGDLVIVTRVDAAEVRAGDVVSVPSATTGGSRLERVVAIEAVAPERWSVSTAAGTAGAPSAHDLGELGWAPSLRLPVVGGIASAVIEPAYAIPLAAGVLLLVTVALLGRAPTAPVRRTA